MPGFFVLRTPLLPFDRFLALGEGLSEGRPTSDSIAEDRRLIRERMKVWVKDPVIREGIYLASPSLEAGIDAWLARPEAEAKVEVSLYKYFARMTGRATPFGTLAGCTTGTVGEHTRWALGPVSEHRRHTRFDSSYVAGLIADRRKDPARLRRLRCRPNPSAYLAAGRLRYAVPIEGPSGRSYVLKAAEPSEHLVRALSRAEGGATPEEIARALVGDDVDLEEAFAFVDTLLEARLLESELELEVSGELPVKALLGRLEPGEFLSGLAARQAELEAIDGRGLGVAVGEYRRFEASLEPLGVPFKPGELLQVDLAKSGQLTVSSKVTDAFRRGAELLARLFRPDPRNELLDWKRAFGERFESEEVPLLEALDAETGVHFGPPLPQPDAAPLLAPLGLETDPDPPAAAFSPLDTHLFLKLLDAGRRGQSEIVLDAAELDKLGAAKLPDAFATIGAVFAKDAAAVDRGEFKVYVASVNGPSGANLIGRFCHADPSLVPHVRAHLRAEEALDPDAIYAEIVHVPDGRLGNLIVRPKLRAHEIAFFGRGAGSLIALSDLTIALEGDRLVLRSKRLGKRIVPRLTSAINFRHKKSQVVHRFLASLALDGSAGGFGFDWGPLGAAPYLPRVSCGDVILSLARWRIGARRMERLAGLPEHERLLAVRALREEIGLPRILALAELDNFVPLDLENPLSIEALVRAAKDKPSVILTELVPGGDELVAEGPEGRFIHEIVIPFVSEPRPRAEARLRKGGGRRSFAPGSEWSYVKLYAGASTVDRLLARWVPRLVDELHGRIDRWFFLRYPDPDWHLRLRLHAPGGLPEVAGIVERAARPLLESGEVTKIVHDTYRRETERYGGPEGIELAEALFSADSAAVLGLLEGAERWRLAALGSDRLLDDLGFDLKAKYELFTKLKDEFGREHGATELLWKRLGAAYRQERPALEAALASSPAALVARSEQIRSIGRRLRELEAYGRLSTTVADLAESFVHLHVNRMLRSSHRAQEMALYYHLHRTHESALARARRAR